MAKRKEICFRTVGRDRIGRQNGFKFYIFQNGDAEAPTALSYSVGIRTPRDCRQDVPGNFVSTAGHQHFTLEGAKEFCQQIAAGEISLEDVLAIQEAQGAAREQAVVREITEKAKKFRDQLEARGLTYMDLLTLEAIHNGLGDIGHNILLGWYRGEGLPNG